MFGAKLAHETIITLMLRHHNYLPYSKCLKILYTNMADKMAYANSTDPDQTEGAVWSGSTLFAIPLSILSNNCIKSKN